jgi:hypothetical protein
MDQREMVIGSMRRRVKIAFVSIDFLEGILNCFDGQKIIEVPIFKGLPEGYKIWSVSYYPPKNCLALTIFHPDFEEVPEFSKTEEIEIEHIKLKKVKVEIAGT